MINISHVGDLLHHFIFLYFLVGLLWICCAAYWVDQVPKEFLSTKQSILLLFILCIAWPINLTIISSHGIKKTVVFEIFCMIYYHKQEWLIEIYDECQHRLYDVSKSSKEHSSFLEGYPELKNTKGRLICEDLEDILYAFHLMTELTYFTRHQKAPLFNRLWQMIQPQA
jgi:hypothetical protein